MAATEIVILADGFDVLDGQCGASLESRMRWNDISEIVAFKLDLGTYDTIRLGVSSAVDEHYIELDEEWSGFPQFVTEIERRFSFSHDWWSRVTLPPFATNLVTLWSKPER
jgi:hypothetical protein